MYVRVFFNFINVWKSIISGSKNICKTVCYKNPMDPMSKPTQQKWRSIEQERRKFCQPKGIGTEHEREPRK